ncbi:heme-dependent oxidative N-demethylase family protein [Devosia sp. SL43]|uniref:heme-dependent oxidative N-demethylase family protein n=1 Tax=Devosia sp. SL43 TaxID=2806348 RepID=UPI001F2E69AE|nr:DUF3445 domain-containing protein [Devosia sp. SL43]UJW84176.1 DUF3445 domain-containing protein [Devosia sp. SL43]
MSLLTPYDGSARLFQIGIKPLDPTEWIDADESLVAQLAEKRRVLAQYPEKTFVAQADTEHSQIELLHLLASHLPTRFPDIYRREGECIAIRPSGDKVDLAARPALLTAAHLVAEDLVLLRRDDSGWRLVAAALAFPSSWVLAEKFGQVMHDIHASVPGFGAGTRPSQLIERMFDNLRVEQPLIRWNWSLYGDDRLYHPDSAGPRRFGEGDRADPVFLRVERQTLRRLPESGDIVFTIRIHVDPLERLAAHPQAPAIATALIEQVTALSDEQADYKGLTLERPRLLARLAELAG